MHTIEHVPQYPYIKIVLKLNLIKFNTTMSVHYVNYLNMSMEIIHILTFLIIGLSTYSNT